MADLNDQHQKIFEEGMQQFQKAFNAGYELNKHEPELLKGILNSPNQSEFIDGMKAGRKQYEKDKFIDQMKQTQEQSKDKQHDK